MNGRQLLADDDGDGNSEQSEMKIKSNVDQGIGLWDVGISTTCLKGRIFWFWIFLSSLEFF